MLSTHPRAGSEVSTSGEPHSPWRLTLKTSGPSYSNLPLSPVLEKPRGKNVLLLPTRSVHMQSCIADAYRSYQVPGDIQPVLTVLGHTQDAHTDPISGPAEIAVNALGLVDTRYRQTLSTFSTVINGITRVCHPNGRQSSLTDNHA